MKSHLSTQYRPPYPYECNIDLSKLEQVHGVTNLSIMPIIDILSSVPYTGDGQYGTSTLDHVLDKPTPSTRHIVNKLDLNLI